MIRNKQFKFIYSTGKRERQDGYKTGFSLPGRTRILFDLQNDPKEMTNLAGRAEFQDVIADFEDEMLRRFQSHPAAKTVPAGLTDREDRLDWFLHYREENDPNLPKR